VLQISNFNTGSLKVDLPEFSWGRNTYKKVKMFLTVSLLSFCQITFSHAYLGHTHQNFDILASFLASVNNSFFFSPCSTSSNLWCVKI
jgi:hypothetical protein